MAKIYYRMIKDGRWTIDRVPEYWRGEVEKLLRENNNFLS